jgi:hypothetical protein
VPAQSVRIEALAPEALDFADERAQQFVEMLIPHVGFGADVLTASPAWDGQPRC